jgi:hypothetical protein
MLASAEPTTGELAELDRQTGMLDKFLNMQQAGLARQESVFSQMDPVFAESLRQSQATLEGKESSLNAPMQRQRAQQREALVNSLRSQMGAGFETSTAGAQALARFDAESQGVSAQVQSQTLGQLNSMTQGLGNLRNATAQTAGALSAQHMSAMGQLQNRKIGALSASDVTRYMAPEEVGNIGRAHASAGLFGSIGDVGGTVLGAGLTAGNGQQQSTGQALGGGMPQAGFGNDEAAWMKYAKS